VTVRNGKVVTVTPLDLPTAVIPSREAYSIGGLVDRGKTAQAQGAERVAIQRSPDKTVRRVVIDRNIAATDAEECYAISHIVTSAEAAARRGDRLRSLHAVARRTTEGRIYSRPEAVTAVPPNRSRRPGSGRPGSSLSSPTTPTPTVRSSTSSSGRWCPSRIARRTHRYLRCCCAGVRNVWFCQCCDALARAERIT